MGENTRYILKILMWILIIGFGCNFILQTISYSFYKRASHKENIKNKPIPIQYNDNLSGYGVNLKEDSEYVILFFGGSNYIAYNTVGEYGNFEAPFLAADYYGSQKSKGKMNLKSMQKTATDLYDWTIKNYKNKKVVVMGHSYGTGIATYLSSVRNCDELFLFSAYRDVSDLYNKIVPIFWGPAKVFISNNIELKEYAKRVNCKTHIIGSNADKTLSADLQRKVHRYFKTSELVIFNDVSHDEYLLNHEVINYVKEILN